MTLPTWNVGCEAGGSCAAQSSMPSSGAFGHCCLMVTACFSAGEVFPGALGQQERRNTGKNSCKQEIGVWMMVAGAAVLFTP